MQNLEEFPFKTLGELCMRQTEGQVVQQLYVNPSRDETEIPLIRSLSFFSY